MGASRRFTEGARGSSRAGIVTTTGRPAAQHHADRPGGGQPVPFPGRRDRIWPSDLIEESISAGQPGPRGGKTSRRARRRGSGGLRARGPRADRRGSAARLGSISREAIRHRRLRRHDCVHLDEVRLEAINRRSPGSFIRGAAFPASGSHGWKTRSQRCGESTTSRVVRRLAAQVGAAPSPGQGTVVHESAGSRCRRAHRLGSDQRRS